MSAAPSEHGDGEATFRRDAAHALSTPLGSLLLQAELIEHFLRQDKVSKAQQALTSWLSDCETFGRLLRSVFAAMSDMAKDGSVAGDPRTCLAEALADIGDETVAIDYRGTSPSVAVPTSALTAMLRRVALEATRIGAHDPVLSATTEGEVLKLSLLGRASRKPAIAHNPFETEGALDLWTIRQIASHYHGQLLLDEPPPVLLGLELPLQAPGPLYAVSGS